MRVKRTPIEIGDTFGEGTDRECVVIEYRNAKFVVVRFGNGFERVTTSSNLRSGSYSNTSLRDIPTIGGIFVSNAGLRFEIIHVVSNDEVYIQFEESGYVREVSYYSIRRGSVRDPYGGTVVNIGDEYLSNGGDLVEVVANISSDEVYVVFTDGYVRSVSKWNLIGGKIKNPFNVTVYGVGYFGNGYHTSSDVAYDIWIRMLARCYSENKHVHYPAYLGCSVDEYWHCFQNFGDWFVTQKYAEGWHLDKDILVKGNMVYSPNLCAMVPPQINGLILNTRSIRGDYPLGVVECPLGYGYHARYSREGASVHLGTSYSIEACFEMVKNAKVLYHKYMADKYRDDISDAMHDAIVNWEFLITD